MSLVYDWVRGLSIHWSLCLKIKFLLEISLLVIILDVLLVIIFGASNRYRGNLKRVFILIATLPLPRSQSIPDVRLLVEVQQVLALDIIDMNSMLVLFKLFVSRQIVRSYMTLNRHGPRIYGP